MKKLFYTEPAKVWNEALPLGNGRPAVQEDNTRWV